LQIHQSPKHRNNPHKHWGFLNEAISIQHSAHGTPGSSTFSPRSSFGLDRSFASRVTGQHCRRAFGFKGHHAAHVEVRYNPHKHWRKTATPLKCNSNNLTTDPAGRTD
jgi:hypothetical protein